LRTDPLSHMEPEEWERCNESFARIFTGRDDSDDEDGEKLNRYLNVGKVDAMFANSMGNREMARGEVTIDIDSILALSVFSIFYSFIRLFANKRIEYKVGLNKVLFLFVNTNKGALIRLFDYSQLKNKGEAANKSTPFCVFTRNGLCRISIEY